MCTRNVSQWSLGCEDCRTPASIQFRYGTKAIAIGTDLKIDLVVDDRVVVELKAVEKLLPVHEAQILTYLRLTGKEIGLLINFNVPLLKEGIRRFLNHSDLRVSVPPW